MLNIFILDDLGAWVVDNHWGYRLGRISSDETIEDNLPWGVVCLAVLIMNQKCRASPLVPHFGFTQCLRDNSFCFLFHGTIGPSELLVNSRWNIGKSPSNLGSRAGNSPKSKVAKSRIIPSFFIFLIITVR